MGKAYCTKCRKVLNQVLSSFECLSTWDKAEELYAPEDDCRLVKRCPDCGALTKDKEKKIVRKIVAKEGLDLKERGNAKRLIGQQGKAKMKSNLGVRGPA